LTPCRARTVLKYFNFAAATIFKDTVNSIGELRDDGKPNTSFRG